MLAGGHSRRMGRDKASLVLDGRTLLDHALERLREAGFTPVRVGCRNPDLSAPIVRDRFPDSGPLAGIEAALRSLDAQRQPQALFTPIDLPLLPAFFLHWLWARAQATGAWATIPLLGGRPQPLCAVYAAALGPHLRQMLEGGERKVMRAMEQAAPHSQIDLFAVESVAPLAGWTRAEPWFANLNTPADWARLTDGRSREAARRI